MKDAETLAFLRRQAAGAECLFSIYTGVLLLGAAGLLAGHRATTHWVSHDLLACFGAGPVDGRAVLDGNLVTAGGVTSGIDAALRVAALLRGDAVAQGLELYLEYCPEPPFHSGSPNTASAEVVAHLREQMRGVIDERQEIARRIAARLGAESAQQ